MPDGSSGGLVKMCALFAVLAVSSFSPQPLTRWSSCISRATLPTCQLFGGKWPWDKQQQQQPDEERGKFVQHKDLEPGCAPLGVVTAGLSEDALEVLAETIESVYEGPDGVFAHVPIAVLSKADWSRTMREVLSDLSERDSVLPERPLQPRVPLVLLSGFSTTATSVTVRSIRALGLTGGSDDVQPMFAVAVPNALDKSFGLLIDEIEGDHRALTSGSAPPVM